jgi:hypothetical protein
VVLFLCGEVYRSQLPAPAYNARQGDLGEPQAKDR